MPSMTVTVSQADSTSRAMVLAVRVITGQTGSPIGASVQTNASGALAASITPTGNGSLILGCLLTTQDNTSYPSTALSGTTTISDSCDGSPSFGLEGMTFKAGSTVSGTPKTVGYDNVNRTGFFADLCLLEILSGGSIAEDGSTPAVVLPSGASNMTSVVSRTTASFNPPGGSLLVAMASSKAKTAPVQSFTITDSQGLTWTSRAVASTSGGGLSQIWTAPVPAGSVTITPATVMAATTIPMPAVITTTFGYSVVGTGTAATATTSSKSTDAATSGSLVGSNSDDVNFHNH